MKTMGEMDVREQKSGKEACAQAEGQGGRAAKLYAGRGQGGRAAKLYAGKGVVQERKNGRRWKGARFGANVVF